MVESWERADGEIGEEIAIMLAERSAKVVLGARIGAERLETCHCSTSAGAYGDTLENENQKKAYDVYHTARRHIQARR